MDPATEVVLTPPDLVPSPDAVLNPAAVAAATSALPGEAVNPTPIAPPNPAQGGSFSFYSMFVFGVFGYALYQIGKKYFAEKRD